MASNSIRVWQTQASRSLDQIESAHAAVGGVGPGRRYATDQLNHAYVVLLSSQFQRYCRGLHTEAANHLTAAISPPAASRITHLLLTRNRKLDHGNVNPGNLGSDFNRFDFDFWNVIMLRDHRNAQRKLQLELLTNWRNAIAHQDFDPALLGGIRRLNLRHVRKWRIVCDNLAQEYDSVVGDLIAAIIGQRPW
jgi:hypothetical protein